MLHFIYTNIHTQPSIFRTMFRTLLLCGAVVGAVWCSSASEDLPDAAESGSASENWPDAAEIRSQDVIVWPREGGAQAISRMVSASPVILFSLLSHCCSLHWWQVKWFKQEGGQIDPAVVLTDGGRMFRKIITNATFWSPNQGEHNFVSTGSSENITDRQALNSQLPLLTLTASP